MLVCVCVWGGGGGKGDNNVKFGTFIGRSPGDHYWSFSG